MTRKTAAKKKITPIGVTKRSPAAALRRTMTPEEYVRVDPEIVTLVIIDSDDQIVSQWTGDAKQAAELRTRTLPRGHRFSE